MGSEHYCLRWNNHQSNLLGVFSQLLRDESLVDVTLACSEGHSIRAHKVVLSACSSYFQTLFVDHPSRHPIVILKDVRFSELRTLVEFMYKGEVNVEYCQLSALLKTAESLKVKGLAEMTNLSSSKDDHDQHQHQQQQSQHQEQTPQPSQTVNLSTDMDLDTESEQTEPTELVNKRLKEDTNSTADESPPPAPLSLRRRSDSQQKTENDSRPHSTESIRPDSPESENNSTPHTSCGPSDMSMNSSTNNNNNNNTISSNNNATVTSCSATLPGGLIGTAPVCSRLPSPHSTEPVAGPSGLPPIQQVPLSLKKEVDWSSTSFGEEKAECSSEYNRHSHESDLLSGVVGGLANISSGEALCLDQTAAASAASTNTTSVSGGGLSPRLYPCMYCGASFPHQSKLTRHILSHSLESLKYRELQHHPLALGPSAGSNLLGDAPLHLIEQHFAGGGGRPPPAPHEAPDPPPDAHALALSLPSPMELELAAGDVTGGGGVVLCKFCGKSFPDVGSLIGHLPAHTGDRPFKCEFCGKAFKLRHHMKDHCRVHTGERPFRCALCGKTFSRSTILKAHEKTHYPKYVRKFLSPSPLDTEEESPH